MPKVSNRARRFRAVILGAMVVAAIQVQAAGPAASEFLGGIFSTIQRRSPTPAPLAYASPTADPWSFLGFPRGLPAPASPTMSTGSMTYCVRLCDGRYFPVQRKTANSSPALICAAQCPASRTDVFTGSGIDDAVKANGLRYAGLETAFLFRERIVADCTCNGRDPYGLAPLDIHSDPTLQRGDIVVTDKGPVAFVGGQRLPHQTAEFIPVTNSLHVSESLRKQLSTLRVARQLALETWLPDTLPDPLPQAAPQSVSRLMPANLSTPVSLAR